MTTATWVATATLIVSAVTLVVYILLAVFAAWAVRESRKARTQQTTDAEAERALNLSISKAEARPYVVIYFDLSVMPIIQIAKENVGKTAATELHVEVTPPLDSTLDDTRTRMAGFVTNPVPLLAPNQSIRGVFDDGEARSKRPELPKTFHAKVRYYGPAVKQWFEDEEQILDLGQYDQLHVVRPKTLRDVTAEIEKLRKIIERLERRRRQGPEGETRSSDTSPVVEP